MFSSMSDVGSALAMAGLAVISLLVTIGTWVITLVADVQAGADVMTILPGSAVAVSSTALVWVVRQFAAGKLLHTDHAANMTAMAAAVERSAHAAEQSNEIASKALEREHVLTQLLMERE